MQFRLHLSQPPPPPLESLYKTPGNLGHSELFPQTKKILDRSLPWNWTLHQ